MVSSEEDAATGATRKGDRAWYFWQYPNFMINCYEGYMDTNLVIPVDVDHCRVVFDFYFSDVSDARRELQRAEHRCGRQGSDRKTLASAKTCSVVSSRGLMAPDACPCDARQANSYFIVYSQPT
mgnify:CR=1 FL=1